MTFTLRDYQINFAAQAAGLLRVHGIAYLSMQWLPVPGYEHLYYACDLGYVYSVVGDRIMRTDKDNSGYSRVVLSNAGAKRYLLHRVIARTFCPGYAEGLVVNHIDGNKSNNAASNLEWITSSANEAHAYRIGLKTSPARKKVINTTTGEVFVSITAAADSINMNMSTLSMMLRGNTPNRTSFKYYVPA